MTATAAQAATSLVSYALPSIGPGLAEEFGLSLSTLGLVLTANVLGQGASLIAAGLAVERFGGRRTMLAGTALSAGGLVAASFASSPGLLIAMLFLSGVGASTVPIAGIGVVFRVFAADRRGWALGVRQMAVPLSGVIGAILLPVLDSVGGASLALRFAAGGIAVFGVSFALVGVEGGPEPRKRLHRPRLELRRIFRAPGMRRLLLVAGLYIVVLQAVLVYLVPSARDAGLSSFWAVAAFFAIQVTAGVARLVLGRIADREGGSRRVRTLTEAGWIAAAGAVLFALALHGGPAVAIPAAVLFAFGALGWNALLYVVAGEKTAPALTSQAVALAATMVFMISAISAPLMGLVADRVGWDVFWLLAAAFALCGALVAHGLPRRELLSQRQESPPPRIAGRP